MLIECWHLQSHGEQIENQQGANNKMLVRCSARVRLVASARSRLIVAAKIVGSHCITLAFRKCGGRRAVNGGLSAKTLYRAAAPCMATACSRRGACMGVLESALLFVSVTRSHGTRLRTWNGP